MKILVMSDTHGHKANIEKAVKKYSDVDCIIHLGDYVRDAEYVKKLTDKKVYLLKGNCDISDIAEQELILTVDGLKVLALHGHQQSVKASLLPLGLYAMQREADLVLFGHTHIPVEELYGNMILYNPGSLGEPRGRKPSVGVVAIENGEISITRGIV
jgi:uncharacterized protein